MAGRLFPVAAIVFAGAFTVLTAAPSGQARSAPERRTTAKPAGAKWTPPRTPWGDPDLQGTWNNGTITPLERPRGAGEKELLSKEEENEINEQSDLRATAGGCPECGALTKRPQGEIGPSPKIGRAN